MKYLIFLLVSGCSGLSALDYEVTPNSCFCDLNVKYKSKSNNDVPLVDHNGQPMCDKIYKITRVSEQYVQTSTIYKKKFNKKEVYNKNWFSRKNKRAKVVPISCEDYYISLSQKCSKKSCPL